MRRYGSRAGNPQGRLEDVTRCIIEVWPRGREGVTGAHQCYRKRGFGKDGLYCKQHAKMFPNGNPFWEGQIIKE